MDKETARQSMSQNPLRIGISTRALFDLDQEHRIFESKGVAAYAAYAAWQREHEDEVLSKGTAFHVVERILALNEDPRHPYVEVVLMSRNSPDLSLRVVSHPELSRLSA